MEIRRFTEADIDRVFEIQQAAFQPLYEKYHDPINPYLEDRQKVLQKYQRDDGFVFILDGVIVGCTRVKKDFTEPDTGFISGLAVHPAYQGRKVATQALLRIEELYGNYHTWKLDTILEEKGNCHLYEKLGYVDTGKREIVNELMTLIFYKKVMSHRACP